MYIAFNGTVISKLHHIMKQVGLDSLKNKPTLSAGVHETLLSGVSALHIGQPEKRPLPLLHTVKIQSGKICQTWSPLSFGLQTSGDVR